MLRKVHKNLKKQGYLLEINDDAMDYMADLGYDPQFGARPMKRVIEKELVNELAKFVLSGQFGPGSTVYVGADAKGLTFTEEAIKADGNTPNSKGKAKQNGSAKKDKKIEDLKQATKDVEDAVKDLKKENGKKKDKEGPKPQEDPGEA